MDAKHGYSLNLTYIPLNNFKLRLESVSWESPSTTLTLIGLQLCLKNPSQACSIVHDAKYIFEKDGFALCKTLRSHSSLAVVSATDGIASRWNSIWDEALEYGVRGTSLMQGLFGALAKPTFGDRACPHGNTIIPASYSDHLFTEHLTGYKLDTVLMWLENKDFDNLFELAEAITSMSL